MNKVVKEPFSRIECRIILALFLIVSSSLAVRASDGPDVAQIQQDLLRLGYKIGAVDGTLGDRTKAAIRSFEERINFSVTGEPSDSLELVLKHYHVDKVDVPKGALVMTVHSGSFDFDKWQSARKRFKEEIPLLECKDRTTEITATGVKCVENED